MSVYPSVLRAVRRVTVRHAGSVGGGLGCGGASHLLHPLDHHVDVADHDERLLRQAVVLALEDLLERADRLGNRHELPRRPGEDFGCEERLRHEQFQLPGAADDHLVLVAQLFDAEDGDDVLEVTVPLQHLLNLPRHAVTPGLGRRYVDVPVTPGQTAPVRFTGNVEARDVYAGVCDVIVCDGFTGNVALKISESLVEMIDALSGGALGAAVSGRLSEAEYGGALLVGVRGIVIVGHGRSSARAVENAVLLAQRFLDADVLTRFERGIAAIPVSAS